MKILKSLYVEFIIHIRTFTELYIPYKYGRLVRKAIIPNRYLAFYEMWDFYPDYDMQLLMVKWKNSYSQRATANAFREMYPEIAERNGILKEDSYDGANLHRYIDAILGEEN